jgi:predicted hydrolase (HD superfamily)
MITNERLLHIINVARMSQKLAYQFRPQDEAFAKNMFLLGFLHDIGYEFDSEEGTHADIAGKILHDNGYKYYDCIAQHGSINTSNFSDELYILNLADMLVNFDGMVCGFDQRLIDIEKRYGPQSKQYKDAVVLIEKLKSDTRYQMFDKH